MCDGKELRNTKISSCSIFSLLGETSITHPFSFDSCTLLSPWSPRSAEPPFPLWRKTWYLSVYHRHLPLDHSQVCIVLSEERWKGSVLAPVILLWLIQTDSTHKEWNLFFHATSWLHELLPVAVIMKLWSCWWTCEERLWSPQQKHSRIKIHFTRGRNLQGSKIY